MNYELAKELKDAGFPLYTQGYTSTELRRMVSEDFVPTSDGQIVPTLPVPTLEELIEACPHTLHGRGVLTLSSSNAGELWIADYLDYSKMKVDDEYRGQGSTPTEAVARLWLALNKKDGTK